MTNEKIRQPIVTVLGHVDHGKCVAPNTMIPLTDGRILTAEEIYELYSSDGNIKKVEDGVLVKPKRKFSLFSFDGRKIVKKDVKFLWKLKSPKSLVKIKLLSGDEIVTTEEHPFFILTKDAEIKSKKAVDITEDDYIIVPSKLNFDFPEDYVKDLLIDKLEKLDNFIIKLNEKSKEFYKELSKANMQEFKRKNLISYLDYSAIKKGKFRAKDYIKLAKLFGFDSSYIYDSIGLIKNSSEKWRAGHTSNWMTIPKSSSGLAKMGYVIGTLAGDGHVSPASCILNKNDINIQNRYIESVGKSFNLYAKVVPQHTCDTVVTNGGKTFSRFVTDIVEFPKADKSSSIFVPEIVSTSPIIFKQFLEGWTDTDGYVSKTSNTIEITSKSKRIVKEVGILLLGLGIHSRVYEKKGYFILIIGNSPYLQTFSDNFNLESEKKKREIINSIKKSSTSRIFDLIPLDGSVLRGEKIPNANKKIPYFNRYYKYKRLSRNFLRKLVEFLPEDSELGKKLKILLEAEISCVKALSKETIKSKWSFVYDFTIPKTHNFVAERFIVHNTTLLDAVRGTSVNLKEPGQITQYISASFVPKEAIKKICGELLDKFRIKITIPGLLFLDTPGHENFITLRKRGGSVCDLAILVIDINEGFQQQTDESLNFLKQFKTPFIVAATKIDKISGWFPFNTTIFLESFQKQRDDVKDELDKKVYQLVSQLSERGFDAERFDRIEEFTKHVAIIPTSGKTKEGISELLMVLTGLAQQFLKDKLALSKIGKGTVLELKEVKGFGATIDAIIYDGVVKKEDYIIIGGKEPVVTKIKALLLPKPMRDLRVEKEFDSVREVHAAAGIKIAAPGLDSVIAGSPIIAVRSEEEIEAAKKEVQKDVEQVEFTKGVDGIIVKADTLGALEAMIKMFSEEGIPIRKAEVGAINKQDVTEAQNVKDDLKKVIFAFNVKPLAEAEELAKDLNIKIFQSNIIYRILEEYKNWRYERTEREMQEKLEHVARPVKLQILKGYIFRASHPCIVGVEILAGYLKKGAELKNKDGKIIGKVKEIEKEGKSIESAKKSDRVAISMDEPIVGRTIFEGDVFVSHLSENDKKTLKDVYEKLSEDEKELLKEL